MTELINNIRPSLLVRSDSYQKIFHDSDMVISQIGSDVDVILSQSVVKNRKLPIAGQQILQDWYLSGPDYLTGEQISGKVILRRMIIQGRSDDRWRIYVKSIPVETWNKLGYKFPLNLPYGNNENGVIVQRTRLYILKYFGDPDPSWINQWVQVRTCIKGEYEDEKTERVRMLNRLDPTYLENMKRWYHEGYRDPNTGLQVTGREVILRCINSGEYTKQFTEYIQSIAKDYRMIEAIGFFLYSQEQSCRLMGIIEKGMKLEHFLSILGETHIDAMLKNIPKENRQRTIEPVEYLQRIRNWYHHGYITDVGNIRTGRSIILECIKMKGSFDDNFRKYISDLSENEIENMRVRMHARLRSIFSYLNIDSKSNIYDFLVLLGEKTPEEIIQYYKKPLRATKTKNGIGNINNPKPTYGDNIPENLETGMRICFRKIKESIRDIHDLNWQDIGVLQQGTRYYIVFRTKPITEKISERRESVEQSLLEGNTLYSDWFFRSVRSRYSSVHVRFELEEPLDVNE